MTWYRAWYWKGTLLETWWDGCLFIGYRDVPDYEVIFFVDNTGNTLELRCHGEDLSLNALTGQFCGSNRFDVTVRCLIDSEVAPDKVIGVITQTVFAKQLDAEDAEKHYSEWKEKNPHIENHVKEILKRLPL